VIVSRANPLFRKDLQTAPAHPLGERVFIRPLPVQQTTEGGLAIADVAKERAFAGILLAVGDQAADRLYDLGVELGDEVWYAKYAGLIEEWQHIIAPGTDPSCPHDSTWDFVPKDDPRWSAVKVQDPDMQLRACRSCGAAKLSERVILATVDDLLCDVDVQARLERGELKRERRETEDGATRYFIVRGLRADNFETGKAS